jgi:pyruvate dehydrogenase E2 component (dihydrolipoamide acetyltransferase)
MSQEFKLPELGEGVESGDVLKVLVSVGDTVSAEQPVVELETDKATIEVPVPFSGTVKEILVEEGGKVEVGQVLLVVETDGVPAAESKEEQAEEPEAKEPELEPEEPVGAEKEEAEPARAAKAAEKAPSERARHTDAVTPEMLPSEVDGHQIVPAAPSVRRIARELGVDVTEVKGSGPAGRITMDDVKAHAKRLVSGLSREGRLSATTPLPDLDKWGAVERQAMSSVRRKTAEHLTRGWTAPHVTNHDRADITELEKLRKRYAERAQAAGGKLTMTAIALKIVASALKVFPQFNASIDMEKEEIAFKKYIHIGVAVDTERGLLVPVVRDVDRKNILELAVELSEVAEKARARKLTLEEMQGGSFTITNLGGIGGTAFTPIINWPEVAILGMSRATKTPVWGEGEFEPRLMLPLSLSYDHRLIDGADAARLLKWLVEAFENPFLLSLEG